MLSPILLAATVATGSVAAAQASAPYADIPANFWDAGRIVVAVRDGFVAPYGQYFRPVWAFTEANLVSALPRLPHGPTASEAQSIVIAAEERAGAAYTAQGTATHAVFALALADALGMGQVAADLAGAPSPWPDGARIPTWDRGAATLMADLGLNWGNTWAGTFQAGGGVERDQAAWALVGAANLGAGAIDRAVGPAVAGVRVASPPTSLVVGQSVPIRAQVVDAGGHPLPVGVSVAATGAVGVRAGDVVYGRSAGTGQVVVRSAAGAAQAVLNLTVKAASQPTSPASAGGGGGTSASGASGNASTGGGAGATGSSSGSGGSAGSAAATGSGGAGGATASTASGSAGSGSSGAPQGQGSAPGPSAAGPFPDVAASSWEAKAAAEAAQSGMLPALKGGRWAPGSPLRELGLARALAAWKGLTPGGGEALVRGALGAYRPYAVVDHAALAEVVVAALGLTVVAADEAALGPLYRDSRTLAAPERGAITVFGHLGLSLGDLPAGRFEPAATTTRAQAAYALVGAYALSQARLGLEASRVVRRVTAPQPTTTPVVQGAAVTLVAHALDAHGRMVPSTLIWRSNDGPVTAQGVFTPTDRGTAQVTAIAPLSGVRATSRLPIGRAGPPPPVSLSILVPKAAPRAGQAAEVRVDVNSARGLAATDSGRAIGLSVTGPDGTSNLSAIDAAGVATFHVVPPAAGTYTLSASAQGLAGDTASLTVADPASVATALALAGVSPTAPEEGAAATFTLDVQTASGQTLTTDQGRTVTLTLTQTASSLPSGDGGPMPAPTVLTATDSAGVATFTWTAGLPGTYSVAASSAGLRGATASLTVTPAPAAAIVLSAPSTMVVVGTTVPITAAVVDAAGQPTVATLPVSVGLGAGSAGTIADMVASVASSAVVAQFTAPATAGATAVVIVTTPGLPPAEVTLDIVASLPQDVPSFAAAPYTTTAGTAAEVVVDVGPAGQGPDPTSSGVPVTLTVAPPSGAATSQTVADASGIASFALPETVAGAYTLSAAIPGQAPVTTTLTVAAGAPAELALTATPSSLLLPGQTATLDVAVADAYGNPEPSSAAVPVTLAAAPNGVGTLTTIASAAPGAVAQFTASAPGTVTVTATSPGLTTATLTILVETSRAALVSGKGMWLMWQDWNTVGAAKIVATALADHISHLYLEVATTHDGFYGKDALDSLLPLAHAAHIAVVAWVYTALSNPAADAAMTVQVAQYVTPTGDRVDGVAADIEDVLTNTAVAAYANAVRAALPSELFVGVTYPPMYHMSYPFKALAKDVDVIAPMDYWHSMPKTYTPTDVYDYVEQSIDLIRQLDGQPSLPIAPIGQAYDMFTNSGTGPNNPTPAEITAAFEAAQADGAIGFSLYRWGTATASEWKTWASLVWGQPGSQGAGS